MSKITFNYSKQAKQISVREKTEKSVHNYVQNFKDLKSYTIHFCNSICSVFCFSETIAYWKIQRRLISMQMMPPLKPNYYRLRTESKKLFYQIN